MHLKQVLSGCILHKVRALGSDIPRYSARPNTWHARESSVEARVTDSTPPSLKRQTHGWLCHRPSCIWSRPSPRRWSALAVRRRTSLHWLSNVSLSVNTLNGQQKSVTLPQAQAARRPSRSAHGLHAQRSHAYYAATSEVSSYTMAPKNNRGFWIFSKKDTIVKKGGKKTNFFFLLIVVNHSANALSIYLSVHNKVSQYVFKPLLHLSIHLKKKITYK